MRYPQWIVPGARGDGRRASMSERSGSTAQWQVAVSSAVRGISGAAYRWSCSRPLRSGRPATFPVCAVSRSAPGTAPRLFAYSLMGLGAAGMLIGLLTGGPPMEDFTFSRATGGAVLMIALIPIYLASARLGKLFPGIPQDIVVAAIGSIMVVGQRAPRGLLLLFR